MNITIKQLRAFEALARCGSFAEACEQLHLSQPALSVAIRNMEDSVGGRLFQRSTRQLALTPEGRQFLPTARRLLADWDRALDDLGRSFALRQGRLRVAAMPSFALNMLPAILRAFRERFPHINIAVDDIVMELVLDAVREGRAELGIAFEPEQLGGLEFTPLFRDRFLAIVPAGSALAKRARLSWRQLAAQPLIAMNRGSWMRNTTDAVLSEAGLVPASLAEASQLATIGRMVAEGLGVSVAPALCRPQLENQGVACVALHGPGIERRVGIFTRRRHALSAPAEALLALMRETYPPN
ncbi:LysR family transcriptional regulator [Parahaliea mediterranea]|uniref:LysR family transcriptional regulator n=1 Tax=Parahaliea mediterranea TaxID=651086 RepID=A0A939IN05_9GAMM|nr:LysR family transcriptional regulator [Parahaliea mediterranea]MBN7797583.1 LysR family transcriptional regulator [Parahaliea mediterranea]